MHGIISARIGGEHTSVTRKASLDVAPTNITKNSTNRKHVTSWRATVAEKATSSSYDPLTSSYDLTFVVDVNEVKFLQKSPVGADSGGMACVITPTV